MSKTRPQVCELYKPGHRVHYIQARKSAEQGAGRLGVVEEVQPDGLVRVDLGDEIREFRIHDPQSLEEAVQELGRSVYVRERQSLLAILTHDGRRLFSISNPDTWEPCRGRGPRPGSRP